MCKWVLFTFTKGSGTTPSTSEASLRTHPRGPSGLSSSSSCQPTSCSGSPHRPPISPRRVLDPFCPSSLTPSPSSTNSRLHVLDLLGPCVSAVRAQHLSEARPPLLSTPSCTTVVFNLSSSFTMSFPYSPTHRNPYSRPQDRSMLLFYISFSSANSSPAPLDPRP